MTREFKFMTLDKAIQILIERKVINNQMIGKDKESHFSRFLQEQNDAIDVVLRELKGLNKWIKT